MSETLMSPAARRMQRRSDAWARGAAEAKLMERERAHRQTYEQRISEGLALVRIAEKLQAGRRGQTSR